MSRTAPPEERLSRAGKRLKALIVALALAIVADKDYLANHVAGWGFIDSAARLMAIKAEQLAHAASIAIAALCTYAAAGLIDFIVKRSVLIRTLILRGRNIEGEYLVWNKVENGWIVSCSTFSHDGRNYREHGEVYLDTGNTFGEYGHYDLRLTLFRDEDGVLEFTYNESRADGTESTGHGNYRFFEEQVRLWGFGLPFSRFTHFRGTYTDDRARTIQLYSDGCRLSSLRAEQRFRRLPFELFNTRNRAELARAFLAELRKEKRLQKANRNVPKAGRAK